MIQVLPWFPMQILFFLRYRWDFALATVFRIQDWFFLTCHRLTGFFFWDPQFQCQPMKFFPSLTRCRQDFPLCCLFFERFLLSCVCCFEWTPCCQTRISLCSLSWEIPFGPDLSCSPDLGACLFGRVALWQAMLASALDLALQRAFGCLLPWCWSAWIVFGFAQLQMQVCQSCPSSIWAPFGFQKRSLPCPWFLWIMCLWNQTLLRFS